MNGKTLLAALVVAAGTAGQAFAAEGAMLKQGVQEWAAKGGKLIAVVGTYQDSVTFRHSYNFFFKTASDDAWNQVAIVGKSGPPKFTWQSAVGAEVTLADGTVVSRPDGLYFIVADKRVAQSKSYYDKGDITATWYKFVESDDDHPDDPPYQLKPAITHAYPQSALTVETVLAREAALHTTK